MKRILILYRELAGYFVECVNYLSIRHNVAVDIIAYPVNPDAPFAFDFAPNVKVFRRNEYSREQLLEVCRKTSYDMIFCGGWGDKDYIKVVSSSGVPVKLLGFDNQWSGSLKQRLAALYARMFLTPHFDVAFVPGPGQVQFAKKMGFGKSKKIITGAYACDVAKFAAVVHESAGSNKKLYFVGRYAHEKFITELCEAVIELNAEMNLNWTLECAGTGPLYDRRTNHPAIVHKGFMQPSQLVEWMKYGDAFILPSTFEPWGVVVHEFAAAGYPLVLSDAVGARHAFLEPNLNGYLFHAGDKGDLKNKLKMLFLAEDSALHLMGEHSRRLSATITQTTWADSLYNLIR